MLSHHSALSAHVPSSGGQPGMGEHTRVSTYDSSCLWKHSTGLPFRTNPCKCNLLATNSTTYDAMLVIISYM